MRRRVRRTFTRPSPKPTVVITEQEPEKTEPIAKMGIEPSRAKPRQEYVPSDSDNDAIVDVVTRVLDALDVGYEVEFEHESYQRIFISLERGEAGMLIGRRGSAIEALEHLLGRMASQVVGHLIPVQVDVNDYRKRLEEELQDMARDVAAKVLETGEDQHLEPMNSRDRRTVHLVIEDIEGIETFTLGEGPGRHIVVARLDDASTDGDG